MRFSTSYILTIFFVLFPFSSHASEIPIEHLDLTQHIIGFSALVVFAVAYVLVILEDKLHFKKSKPVLFAAGIIWFMIAIVYPKKIS